MCFSVLWRLEIQDVVKLKIQRRSSTFVLRPDFPIAVSWILSSSLIASTKDDRHGHIIHKYAVF